MLDGCEYDRLFSIFDADAQLDDSFAPKFELLTDQFKFESRLQEKGGKHH